MCLPFFASRNRLIIHAARTIAYTYNNLSQKVSVTNDSYVINYNYYANGWLKNVMRGANTIAEYAYDNVGNRTKLTYGNGSYEDFSYDTDPRYRLEGIDYAYRCDSGSPVTNQGGLDFTRDKSGNPLTWGNDEYTKSYGYDNNSRLTSASYPGQGTIAWSYDWVGNRTISGYTYNTADQLTASPGKSYTYDNAGNLTAITGTGAKTFTYTPNNLVNTVTSGGNTSTMLWDNSGKRVRLTTSTSQVYNYLHDKTAGIPAVIEEVTPGGSIYYIREPNGALLARISGGLTGGTTQYYHFDELGNTVFLTDSNAVLTDKYTYDAWGNVTSHTGSSSQPYQYVGQLGYYTHYNDTNLPYIQTGVRLYNPEVGRYMQRDWIRKGVNLYRYAINNSLKNVDFNGLSWTTNDFVKHYFLGFGKSVNLADVGLLDEYISQSSGEWGLNEKKHLESLKSDAVIICQNSYQKGKSVHMQSTRTLTSYTHVGQEDKSNPLYSLGGGTLTSVSVLNAELDCCSRKLKYWSVNAYLMTDRFTDPVNGKEAIGIGIDLPGGIPYDIYAYWSTSQKGVLSF